ncbi:WecB/TagA/CpsF family glycosyltransferase, partial [Clostridium paraputrificum]
CKPDILAVGLGAPKQEKFIYRYREELGVPISLAIGATIDFEAGNIKRAPKWMQKSGLEWFYRLCKEPKRMFKRYIVDDIKILKIAFKYRKVK